MKKVLLNLSYANKNIVIRASTEGHPIATVNCSAGALGILLKELRTQLGDNAIEFDYSIGN